MTTEETATEKGFAAFAVFQRAVWPGDTTPVEIARCWGVLGVKRQAGWAAVEDWHPAVREVAVALDEASVALDVLAAERDGALSILDRIRVAHRKRPGCAEFGIAVEEILHREFGGVDPEWAEDGLQPDGEAPDGDAESGRTPGTADARLEAVRELAEGWAKRAAADRSLAEQFTSSPYDMVSSDCGREILAILGEAADGD